MVSPGFVIYVTLYTTVADGRTPHGQYEAVEKSPLPPVPPMKKLGGPECAPPPSIKVVGQIILGTVWYDEVFFI